ncbi:hypothetical protein QAD02_006877 [Eretmocerus hayati]|uniref:Uncharacterized protein n=1 Tax=Eretmocerus hayati TaxID=131215 RepID=A0ACC2N223_9HYME|nr:hypothetical protein QAD02_006877 [Eretmocerus hayati]
MSITVFLIAVVAMLSSSSPAYARIDRSRDRNSGPQLLYFKIGGELWKVPLTPGSSELRPKLVTRSVHDFDVDEVRDRLYWIESESGRLFYRGLSYDSSDAYMFHWPTSRFDRTGLNFAFDFATERFYAINSPLPMTSINASNIENSSFATSEVSVLDYSGRERWILNSTVIDVESELLSDQRSYKRERLEKIVLDPNEGLIFVVIRISSKPLVITRRNFDPKSQKHQHPKKFTPVVCQILKYNTNGTTKTHLVSGATISDISASLGVNRKERRIFWLDSKRDMIESVDYDGQDRKFVVKTQNALALTAYRDKLFWISHDGNGSLVLSSCQLAAHVCRERDVRPRVLPSPSYPHLSSSSQPENHQNLPQYNSSINPKVSLRWSVAELQPPLSACDPEYSLAYCEFMCLRAPRRLTKRACSCRLGPRSCPDSTGRQQRDRRQIYEWDDRWESMNTPQPTIRSDPQQDALSLSGLNIPLYILYHGK